MHTSVYVCEKPKGWKQKPRSALLIIQNQRRKAFVFEPYSLSSLFFYFSLSLSRFFNDFVIAKCISPTPAPFQVKTRSVQKYSSGRTCGGAKTFFSPPCVTILSTYPPSPATTHPVGSSTLRVARTHDFLKTTRRKGQPHTYTVVTTLSSSFQNFLLQSQGHRVQGQLTHFTPSALSTRLGKCTPPILTTLVRYPSHSTSSHAASSDYSRRGTYGIVYYSAYTSCILLHSALLAAIFAPQQIHFDGHDPGWRMRNWCNRHSRWLLRLPRCGRQLHFRSLRFHFYPFSLFYFIFFIF